MDNGIKQNQLILLLIVVVSGGKFLSLPALIAKFAGRDGWISMSIMFVADLVCLLFLLWAIKLNKNKTIDKILAETITPVGARIVFLIYGLFFVLRIMGGLLDMQELVSSTLSVVTNWIAFIVPILIVICFNVLKGAKNVGRVTQIFFPMIFASVILILLLSFKNTDFTNLQPHLADGFGIVAKSAFDVSFWFGDCLFVLFLFGNISKGRFFSAKILLAFIVGAVLTVLLDMVFLSLFGNLAQYSSSAVAKVSGFNLTGSVYGRIEWIFVVMWASSIIIKATLFLWAATMAFSYTIGTKTQKGKAIIFFVIALSFVAVPLFVPVKDVILNVFCVGEGKYVTMFVQYLLPLSLPLLVFLSNKKSRAKAKNEVQND